MYYFFDEGAFSPGWRREDGGYVDRVIYIEDAPADDWEFVEEKPMSKQEEEVLISRSRVTFSISELCIMIDLATGKLKAENEQLTRESKELRKALALMKLKNKRKRKVFGAGLRITLGGGRMSEEINRRQSYESVRNEQAAEAIRESLYYLEEEQRVIRRLGWGAKLRALKHEIMFEKKLLDYVKNREEE